MTASSSPRTLDVVVPLFREGAGIAHFHSELRSVLDGLATRYTSRVIYVVDPAGDDTEEQVRRICLADPQAGAVVMLRRAGHQMSLVAGMNQSTADACITMDGDLQHPPSLIPEMLALFEAGNDVVQTVRKSTEGQSRLASALSAGFYRLMNRFSDVAMVPGGADFRLMSARVVQVLTQDVIERDRFLRGLIPWLGLPTAQLEFVAPAREAGQSNYSFARSMSLAVSGLVSFSKFPLHVGIGLGMVISALAVLAGLGSVLLGLSGADIPAGWATLAVMLALLSGAQLVSLGLIGLYIGVIVDEVKARPQMLVAGRLGAVIAPGPTTESAESILSTALADARVGK